MTVVVIAIIETDKQTVRENDSFPRLLTFKLLGLNPYATNTHTRIYVNRIVCLSVSIIAIMTTVIASYILRAYY